MRPTALLPAIRMQDGRPSDGASADEAVAAVKETVVSTVRYERGSRSRMQQCVESLLAGRQALQSS